MERFTKKNCKWREKTNQKEFRVEKVITRKGAKLYVKWKDQNNSFNSCIDKKDIVPMNENFPKPRPLEGNVNVEFDLFDYARKADLKNAASVDRSNSA